MTIEMKMRGLMIDPVSNMPIIILKDPDGDSVLPIWVGIFEANAIAMQLEKIASPRPMTHDLLKNVIEGLDVLARLQRIDPAAEGSKPDPDKIVKAEVIRKRDHEYKPTKMQ